MVRRSARAQRLSLALRGAAAIAVLLVAAVAAVATSAGVFTEKTTVTTSLPVAAGPIRDNTPVQFRGVKVGTLDTVVPNANGANLTLDLDPRLIHQIPADVQVRLLPRTLFGTQYIDLAETHTAGEFARLAAGAYVPPDTSRPTAQLYTTYMKMYQLLNSVQPAKIQVALTAMADALRGRGEELGGLIDDSSALMHDGKPMLDNLESDLHTTAKVSDALRASTPDLLRTLDNAIELSKMVVQQRSNISALFNGGVEVTGRSQQFLADNSSRVIQLVRAVDPITEIMGDDPAALSQTKASMDIFLNGANRAFSTGFFKIRATGTFENPNPYCPQDCPRYGTMAGPNCDASQQDSGPIGPVGSPQEHAQMQQLAPLLPTPPGPAPAPPSPDLLGLLMGPMVRGSEVVTP